MGRLGLTMAEVRLGRRDQVTLQYTIGEVESASLQARLQDS